MDRIYHDCKDHYAYGNLCVYCGCSNQKENYVDRLKCQLQLCKEALEENRAFKDFSNVPVIKELQLRNIELNDLYFRRKIGYIRRELNRLTK